MARRRDREEENRTIDIPRLRVPRTVLPEARPEFERQAALFRNITEYIAGDGGISTGGTACVFEYHAKDGSWQWGWAPHEAQYLLQAWFRQIYKADSSTNAIDRALRSIDWQSKEAKARYQLLGAI